MDSSRDSRKSASVSCKDAKLEKLDDAQQNEQSLEVDFSTEKYAYQGFNGYTVSAEIQVGSTVRLRGRHLVSHDGSIDSTGVMLWPASHLLCQYFASCASINHRTYDYLLHQKPGTSMIEFGCGCGISSIIAALTRCASYIVCTDVDLDAISLCQLNISSILKNYNNSTIKGDIVLQTERLSWGNVDEMDIILSRLPSNEPGEGDTGVGGAGFDVAVGADIVYPSTSAQTLNLLLRSVKYMIHPVTGFFLLSFISRDGFRSALRLIQACNENGFEIDFIDESKFCIPFRYTLPPLMGAKLLLLRPCSNDIASRNNELFGGDDCKIFPGIKSSLLRSLEETSDEEWAAPPLNDKEE